MSDKQKIFDALIRKADKLERSAAGYSTEKKLGYLKLSGGGWRSPEVHNKLIDIYTEAMALDQPPFMALHRRATTQMYGGFFDQALADLRLLEELGSSYAKGIFPLQLYMLRGEREAAQQQLDYINERNKTKGLPKQKFSDFRLD